MTSEPEPTWLLSALTSRNFRVFWASSIASNVGGWMQLFAGGYLVVQLALRDGAPHLVPLYAGFVGLAQALPGLAFGLVAGVAADRYDRRRVVIITQLLLAILAASLGLLTLSGQVAILHVLGITALTATVTAFEAPTRFSLLPSLVARRQLVSAVGLNSASFNGAQIVGPMLAGLLILPLGIGAVFLLAAVSSAISAGGQLLVYPGRTTSVQGERPAVIQSIGEGLAYIVRDPVVRWIIVLTAGSQFLVRPYTQLLPTFAEGVLHFGALELSWLMSASGFGALAGALGIASLGGLERRGRFLLLVGFALALTLVIFTTQRTLIGALAAVAALSFAVVMFQGTVNTSLQLGTPEHLRGRVMSVLMLIPAGVMPLGVATQGFVGSATGIEISLAVAGFAFAGLTLFGVYRWRELWRATDFSGEPQPPLPEEPLNAALVDRAS